MANNKPEQSTALIENRKVKIGKFPQIARDELGRFTYGHEYLPTSPDGVRNAARKAFLDALNGLAGEKRLLRLAEIAEGAVISTVTTADGKEVDVVPSVREQLDANTTLLYLQFGRPAMQVDVQATHSVKVRWDPDKYAKIEDLEKYLELQKIGEIVDGEVVSQEGEADVAEGEK